MIDAIKFRELVNALEGSRTLSDWGAEGVAMRNLERFLLSHADALLALVETTDMLKSFMEIGEQP